MVPAVTLNAQRRVLGLALLASVAVHVGAMDLLPPLGDAARRAFALLRKPAPLLEVTLVTPAPRVEPANAPSTPMDTPVPVKPQAGGTRGTTNVALVAVPARSESAVAASAPPARVSETAGAEAEPASASPETAAAPPASSSANVIANAALSSPAAYRVNPPPGYPEAARRDGQQGLAILDVRVAKSGIPVEITVATTSGFPALDAAAVAGVRHWLFTPATKDGEAIEARIGIPVRFRLAE